MSLILSLEDFSAGGDTVKKIGFLVNPIAGMGGRVGLKGTDALLEEALKKGAEPEAHIKAENAIKEIVELKDKFEIYTGPENLGEDILLGMGFEPHIVEIKRSDSADDTKALCKSFNEKVDLIVFAGGDGTARDVLDATAANKAVIGIPAGVKIHSAVFAKRPKEAGLLLSRYIKGELRGVQKAEVMDIDEELYRENIISSKLYGYLEVPYDTKLLQGKKSRSLSSDSASQQSIAWDIVDNMEADILYIIGPGSTTSYIMKTINIDGTLIGFDAVLNKKLVGRDMAEKDILKLIEEFESAKIKLVITPIGGQGIILGRGNQQLSSKVLRHIDRKNVIVAATKTKLAELRGNPFIIDLQDEEILQSLKGYLKVVTGYNEYAIYKAI